MAKLPENPQLRRQEKRIRVQMDAAALALAKAVEATKGRRLAAIAEMKAQSQLLAKRFGVGKAVKTRRQ